MVRYVCAKTQQYTLFLPHSLTNLESNNSHYMEIYKLRFAEATGNEMYQDFALTDSTDYPRGTDKQTPFRPLDFLSNLSRFGSSRVLTLF